MTELEADIFCNLDTHSHVHTHKGSSGCVITDHRLGLPSFPTKTEEGRKAGLTPVLVERHRLPCDNWENAGDSRP